MTQQSRITSLFGDLLEQPKDHESRAVVVKTPISGLVDVQLSSGEILRRVILVGGAAPGDTVTLRYTAGEYTALASGAASQLGGGPIVLGSTGSTGPSSGAPSPHDLLGIHHTLPVLSASVFLASPSGSTGFPSFRAVVPADLPGQFSGFGNPTAQVGLTAINGSATTAMRSDAAPALNVSITPTWTGAHTWSATSTFNAQVNINEFLQVTKTAEQLRLRYDAGNITAFTVDASGSLTITNSGNVSTTGNIIFNPLGRNMLPNSGYTVNIGSLQKKYLTLHVAELWVETLVAQDTIATIGGRVLICPTTVITRDMGTGDSTIYVKHNQMQAGDVVYMEANGLVEWFAITSNATTITQGVEYSYTVTRNLDGTGANAWSAGDAMANTGSAGSGFIDLYSLESVRALTFDYIFNFTASGSVFSANFFNDSSISIMGATNTVGDMMYFGSDLQFDGIHLYIQTGIVESGGVRVFEYWNGSAWVNLVSPTVTGSLALVNPVDVTWTIGSQTGWVKTTINAVNAYWVRYRLTAGTVTTPARQGYRRVYRSKNTWGPTIAGMYRSSGTYSDIDARWAIGNLNGWYDYSGQMWGAAFGNYATTWVGIDATNGFRIMNSTVSVAAWDITGAIRVGVATGRWIGIDTTNGITLNTGATRIGQWDASGNVTIGEVSASKNNVYITNAGVLYIRANTTNVIKLSTGTSTIGSWYSLTSVADFLGHVAISGIVVITGGVYYNNIIRGAKLVRVDTSGSSNYQNPVFESGQPSLYFENQDAITATLQTQARLWSDSYGPQSGSIGYGSAFVLETFAVNIYNQSGGGLVANFGTYLILRAPAGSHGGGGVRIEGTLTVSGVASFPGAISTLNVANALAVGNSAYNASQIGTDAIIAGSIATDYTPTSSNWYAQSTLLLNAQTYSVIGFHDSGARVDFIRAGGGIIVIGYDGGFGAARIEAPGGISAEVNMIGQRISSADDFGAVICPIAYNVTAQLWTAIYYIVTTNDGSNYWTFTLKRISDNATIDSFNTSAASANTWTRTQRSISSALTTSHVGVYVDITKTGSPGNCQSGQSLYLK